MLGRSILILAAVGLLLAGCVSPATNVDPASVPTAGDLAGSERIAPPDKDLSKAIVSDHGAPYMHAIPDLHKGSYRMDLAGYNPMTAMDGDDPVIQNSAYAAITLFNDTYACVGHFAGTGGVGGASILDVTDPAKPRIVASIPDMALVSRCQFTDDGKLLLVGSYAGAPTPGVPELGPMGDLGSGGITVYDVSDVKHPKFVAHDVTGVETSPGGITGSAYHNFATVTVNGTYYLFQTYTGNVLTISPDGKTLKIVAHLDHADHDFWVGRHPITKDLYLVTGAGQGTAFFDINDPEHPELVGVWETTEKYQGWHRQWGLDQTVGGKAIMIVAGEECTNGKSLPYTVVDWTDPTTPIEMGHWQIPGNPAIQEPGQLCSMNSHEFNTWNGYVATGNYHAGVWVFDVGSPERLVEPVTVGYYEPHEDPRAHAGTRNTPFAWSPDVWGAYFDNRGYVHAADWYSGYYVLKIAGVTKE
jgi:hypothetical protein